MKYRIELVNVIGISGVFLNTDIKYTSELLNRDFGKIFTSGEILKCFDNDTNKLIGTLNAINIDDDEDDDDWDDEEDDDEDE